MADPKGNLVTPVGHRSDGSIHSLELTNSDELKTYSTPLIYSDVISVTQIIKEGLALNNTVTLHTVTAGKTFYLTSISFSMDNSGAAASRGWLYIRDAADTIVATWAAICHNGLSVAQVIPFSIPIPIAAGYDLTIQSFAATIQVEVTITGFEK